MLNTPLRKLLCLLLAGLLLLPMTLPALAEELPDQEAAASPAPQEPEDWLALPEETPSPEPFQVPEALAPEAGPSPASGEEAADPEMLEAPSVPLEAQAASSLLRTGDHEPYLKGYSDGTFRPSTMMTRAEAAQMLYALLREPVTGETPRFTDVRSGSWYAPAVAALTSLEVLEGFPDGTFRPNETITRAAFVTVVTRCFDLEPGTASFTDVASTSWAYEAIAAATSMGWIEGVGDGTFQPNRGIRRSEAVTVMNRALGRTGEGFAANRGAQQFSDVPTTHWAYLQITEAAKPEVVVQPTIAPTPTPTPAPTAAPTATPTAAPVTGFAAGDTVSVTATSGLNLRTGPSTDTSIVTTLSYGARLTVTSVSGQWLGVRDASNRTGYVHSDYVVKYVPGSATGATLSASSLTLHQYQTVRLDGSITSGDLSSMVWTSSSPGVAGLGYIVEMGSSRTYAAMIYARSPGTTTLTFSDRGGTTKATCTVTVQAAEPIRFAYSSENCATAGQTFDLIAVTDVSQTEVTFSVNGQTYPTELYTTESRISGYGLPTNTNHVFRRAISFAKPGTYSVTASAGGGSKTFSLLVLPAGGDANTTSTAARMTSTRELRLIATYEGSLPEVEDDSIAWGNPTVGYGYVVQKNVVFYNNLTPSEMFAMLADKVNTGSFAAGVNNFRSKYGLRMSQAQFDALVSFVYNLGPGILDPDDYTMPNVMLNAVQAPANLSESAPVTGKLNIESGKLYESPGTTAKTLANVAKGSTVSVIGVEQVAAKRQVWYKVKLNNQTGYIPAGLVQLQGSGLVPDLAWSDATILANHFLQFCHAGNSAWAGLVYRRLAEAKIFFFADYTEADPNANWSIYKRNTYGFIYPDDAKPYEK